MITVVQEVYGTGNLRFLTKTRDVVPVPPSLPRPGSGLEPRRGFGLMTVGSPAGLTSVRLRTRGTKDTGLFLSLQTSRKGHEVSVASVGVSSQIRLPSDQKRPVRSRDQCVVCDLGLVSGRVSLWS